MKNIFSHVLRSVVFSVRSVHAKSPKIVSLCQGEKCQLMQKYPISQPCSTFRNQKYFASAKFKWTNQSSHNAIFVRFYTQKKTSRETEVKPETNEWESFLDNEEKKNDISKIPAVRENIFTIPNLLSLSRIVVAPCISHLIINGQYNFALGLFVVAGISDLLDGQIARIWPSQQSALGTALDPLGDKILVTVLTLSLTYANILPGILTTLIVTRDVGLVLAVFYLRYRTCPPPLTLKRYFDPTLVNAKLNPTTISKVNTALQMSAISASMCAPVWNFVGHPLLLSLYAVTAATTVWSGGSYIFSKDTVRILKSSKT